MASEDGNDQSVPVTAQVQPGRPPSTVKPCWAGTLRVPTIPLTGETHTIVDTGTVAVPPVVEVCVAVGPGAGLLPVPGVAVFPAGGPALSDGLPVLAEGPAEPVVPPASVRQRGLGANRAALTGHVTQRDPSFGSDGES